MMIIGKLPIKKITLYQHGVAYIERRAVFNSKDPLSLSFEDKEMNDVLKSLCVFDMGRGKVTGVSYETSEDLEAQIAKKAIKVPRGNAIFGLLEALRGYRVSISLREAETGVGKTNNKVSGRFLGMESDIGSRYESGEVSCKCTSEDDASFCSCDKKQIYLVIVDERDKFVSVPLASTDSIRLDDQYANSDLEYFLDASQSLRKGSYKRMTVYLEGDEHDLSIGYLTTMPAWRVSYRLLYSSEGPHLQGWGIVENQLDEDLDKVKLTMISGMPISFIYEIYSPSSIERPYVHEDRAGMNIPVKFEEDMDLDYTTYLPEKEEHIKPEYYSDVGYQEDLKSLDYDEEEIEEEVALTKGSDLTTRVDSEKVDLGEQFRYDIEKLISIKRGNSALVPLFDSAIDCSKEHLFNEDTTGSTPLVCMLLKNNLGNILDRGPITVIDNGKYSGEAILPFTTYDAENRIAYAKDQALECSVEIKDDDEIKGFKREKRNLRVETWLIQSYTYEVENSKNEDVTVILEHPRSEEHDIFETQDMLEETENYQRWRFKAQGDKKTVFQIKQRKLAVTLRDIKTLPEKSFSKYVESKLMDKELQDFCRDIINKWKDITENNNKITKLNKHMQALELDINRLQTNRDNLTPSKRHKELMDRNLKEKLDGLELVELNSHESRNPLEHKLYSLYTRAISEHRKRVTRRKEGVQYLTNMNDHHSDMIEYRFGNKDKKYVREAPRENITEDIEKMLGEDLVKYLINPIQQGGV